MYSEDEIFEVPASRQAGQPGVKRWFQRWWGRARIIFLAIFFTIFTALAFYVGKVSLMLKSGQITPQQLFGENPERSLGQADNLATKDDPAWGRPDAKIVIVEFGDFLCPACRQEYPVVKQVLRDYSDKVLFVFRDFPADQSRPLSVVASVAADCALEQGKFWEMHDQLFSLEGELTEAKLKTLAIKIGLNSLKFDACLRSDKYLKEIEEDLQAGYAAGTRATPTFFINGAKIEGALPFSVFEKIITAGLSQ